MGMSQIVGPLKFPPPLGTSWGNWINPVVSFEPLSSPCQLTTVLAGATQVDVPINADTGALDCSVGLAGARITILSFATATYCQLLFWVAFSFCHVLYMNMYIYIYSHSNHFRWLKHRSCGMLWKYNELLTTEPYLLISKHWLIILQWTALVTNRSQKSIWAAFRTRVGWL